MVDWTVKSVFRFPVLAMMAASCSLPVAPSVGSAVAHEHSRTQVRTTPARDRMRMVEQQLANRDIRDPQVLDAMGRVPRHRFVPVDQQQSAYEDRALPIGYRQTISQPYIVAYMTQALQLNPDARVLEIGTGSGYQAAILSEVAAKVYTMEIVPELANRARETLSELGHTNVEVRLGDGYEGWEDEAPFDAIMVTAAPDHVPEPLIEQLAPGGRLIIPVGENRQSLTLVTRTPAGVIRENLLPVLFVPMTGRAER